LAAGQGVGLTSELSGAIMDDIVKPREKLRPVSLMPGQLLGGGEVFKSVVVRDDDGGLHGTFEI